MSAATDTNVNSLHSRFDGLRRDGTEKGRGQAVLQERMLTPEPTPEPDLARNEADERRRKEAEQATSNTSHGGARAETPSPPTEQPKDVETRSKPDVTEDDDAQDDSDDKPPTEEQVAAVKEVLEAKSNDHSRILSLKKERSAYQDQEEFDADVLKSFVKRVTLVHPDYNKHDQSNNAYRRKFDSLLNLRIELILICPDVQWLRRLLKRWVSPQPTETRWIVGTAILTRA